MSTNSFFLFLFLFLFFVVLSWALPPFFSFFIFCLLFFFSCPGLALPSSSTYPPPPFNGFPRRCLLFFLFFSFFFLCLTRHDFYFLMNWVIFFGCLSFICFNWPSFFNKGIWVNLDKLTFFIPPLFHSQSNKEERN